MMGSTRDMGDFDLLLIFILSCVFVIILIFLPKAEVLRIFFGLPFILFYPGYSLVSLLFPLKEHSIKRENHHKMKKKPDRGIHYFNSLIKKEKIVDNSIGEEGREIPDSISLFTRLTLSVALSLAITPSIGIILNLAYPLNNELFGFNLYTILASLFFFIISLLILALIRRRRSPEEKRYKMEIKPINLFEKERSDKVITISIISLILISTGLSLFLYKYYHENEKFTEFFLFGEDKSFGNYPRYLNVNETRSVYLGIINNEFEDTKYSVNITLRQKVGLNQEHDGTDHLNILSGIEKYWTIELTDREEYLKMVEFNIQSPGNYWMEFNLLKNGYRYRELTLKMLVFKKEDLIRADNNITYFLTGPNSDPNSIRTSYNYSDPLDWELNVLNDSNQTLIYNMTIRMNNQSIFTKMNSSRTMLISEDQGGYFHLTIPPSRYEVIDLKAYLPPGTHTVFIGPNNFIESYTFTKEVSIN